MNEKPLNMENVQEPGREEMAGEVNVATDASALLLPDSTDQKATAVDICDEKTDLIADKEPTQQITSEHHTNGDVHNHHNVPVRSGKLPLKGLLFAPDKENVYLQVARKSPILWMSHNHVPYGGSYESIIGSNGQIFQSEKSEKSEKSSHTGSQVRHRIKLEEVAPTTSSLTGGDKRDWQVPLHVFSSSRHGKQEEDKYLSKSVRRYYKLQDELITHFEEINLEVDDAMENTEEQTKINSKARILAKVTFFTNLLLLVIKIIAAILSGSLSIISSLIDSAVDLVSGALMWWSNRAMKNRNPYNYPQGRTKLEPLSIVILSVVMSLASVQMIKESVEKIINYVDDVTGGPTVELPTILICLTTIVVKLILFFVCKRVKHSASLQALAQDHRNDVLSNSVALICSLIGYHFWRFADPIGAILISGYIIVSWFLTGYEQMKMLTGHTARPDFLKMITWIALNHHPKIELIDTVRAFHFGNNFLVEVDIVLPEDMKLKESHDIGESLQLKIERLTEVERAFVHLDYEWTHHPNSEHKVV